MKCLEARPPPHGRHKCKMLAGVWMGTNREEDGMHKDRCREGRTGRWIYRCCRSHMFTFLIPCS